MGQIKILGMAVSGAAGTLGLGWHHLPAGPAGLIVAWVVGCAVVAAACDLVSGVYGEGR